MSLSLIERINNVNSKKSLKSASYGGSWGYAYYGDSRSGDLPLDEWGMAISTTVNVAMSSALQVWQNFVGGLKWELHDRHGNILLSSDMRDEPQSQQGAILFRAIRQHEIVFQHGLFESVAFADWLYGENYIRLVCPTYSPFGKPTALQWLNPLYVEPQIIMGWIDSYWYSGEELKARFSPKEVAYRIKNRNPFQNMRGLPPALAAMNDVNLEQNTKKALSAWFRNNMSLGGVISPTGDDVNLTAEQMGKMEDNMRNNHKGASKAGTWMIAPSKMNITPYPATRIDQNFAVVQPLRSSILQAMHVNPTVANDPSQVAYDNADPVYRNWARYEAIPYVRTVEDYFNNQINGNLESEPCYLKFNVSQYEVEDAEVISQDVNAGFLSIGKAQAKRGYDEDKDLTDIYVIAGRPLSKQVLIQLASTMPAQEQLDMAQADKATSEAESVESEPTPLVPMTSLEAPIADAVPNEITNHYPTSKHIHEHVPSIKTFEPVQETMLDELEAWRKFALSGKKSRAFSPVWLLGDLSDSIQASLELVGFEDKPSITKVFADAKAIIETRIKAIQATRLDFEGDFDELLNRARRDKMGRVQWSSAMRSIIRRYGERAYVDGLNDGGVEDKPSDDDRITINELASSNSQYVTELGNVLYKGDSISDAQADIKAALWYNKTIAPFYHAGLLSADANGMYQWVLGNTEVHCNSCLRLQGQRHRLKKWKATIMPQSDDLDCGGWKCDCNLVKSRGQERGNF